MNIAVHHIGSLQQANNEEHLITALVDTYNDERYIEEAILSVLGQGLSPSELEILVVDDGSTDDAASAIRNSRLA